MSITQCDLCPSKMYIYCKQCDNKLCFACDYVYHSKAAYFHDRKIICEECDDELELAVSYCPDCKQLLCQKCDAGLHRKGTRQQHQRRAADLPKLIEPKQQFYKKAQSDVRFYEDQSSSEYEELISKQFNSLKISEEDLLNASKTEQKFTTKYGPAENKKSKPSKPVMAHKRILGGVQYGSSQFKPLHNIEDDDILSCGVQEDTNRSVDQKTDEQSPYQIEQEFQVQSIEYCETSNREELRYSKRTLNKPWTLHEEKGPHLNDAVKCKAQSFNSSFQSSGSNNGSQHGRNGVDNYYRSNQGISTHSQKSGTSNKTTKNVGHLPEKSKNHIDTSDYKKDQVQVDQIILVTQPFLMSQNQQMTTIQAYLFKCANQGQLLVPITQVYQVLPTQIVQKAAKLDIVHQIVRKFAGVEPQTFISLKIQVLSLESLTWVLTSLKSDEMTTSETAIKNRIKEAFQLKLEQNQWNAIINHIIQGKQPTKFRFKLLQITDEVTESQDKYIVYKEHEQRWLGVDSNVCQIQIDPHLYEITKNFLHDYFHQDSTWDINDSLVDVTDEEVKAIPGGRYGCTQYLKLCGPQEIKRLSVGRIMQMVQQAIKEDVLRHHKTLLVWSAKVDKHKLVQNNLIEDSTLAAIRESKLNQVKQALTEILAESKNGMSLAQLPQNLNKKLVFPLDLNELGFPKLKDLILSMSDRIKLELKGTNHPFAYLLRTSNYDKTRDKSEEFSIQKKNIVINKSNNSEDLTFGRHIKSAFFQDRDKIERIFSAFMNLLREYPTGVRSFDINRLISDKVGFQFSHRDLNCKSELEFIKKYIQPKTDIDLISGSTFRQGPQQIQQSEPYFLVRSLKFYKYMQFHQSQYTQQMHEDHKEYQVMQDEEAKRLQTQPAVENNDKMDLLGYIPSNVSLYGSNNESEWSISGIAKGNNAYQSLWSESIFLQPGSQKSASKKSKGDSNFIQNQLIHAESAIQPQKQVDHESSIFEMTSAGDISVINSTVYREPIPELNMQHTSFISIEAPLSEGGKKKLKSLQQKKSLDVQLKFDGQARITEVSGESNQFEGSPQKNHVLDL